VRGAEVAFEAGARNTPDTVRTSCGSSSISEMVSGGFVSCVHSRSADSAEVAFFFAHACVRVRVVCGSECGVSFSQVRGCYILHRRAI